MQFKDVPGHTAIKQQLVTAVKTDRISHAQLLLGKLGFGGLPLTLAFIQYLFCEDKGDEDSCGVCSSCKNVSELQHPDVHFTFPTVQALAKTSDEQFQDWKKFILDNPHSNLNEWINHSDPKGRKPIISIHQSEAIVKKLALKSFAGGYKVSIIWMADAMNDVCANKLLKIIEEPPAKTLFILLVEQQETIMPTILSRTQIKKIKQLTNDEIEHYLNKKASYDHELVRSSIARSEGNLGAAIGLLSMQNGTIQNRSLFIELMRVCFKKDVISMLDWADKIAGLGREEQKDFLLYALYMIRQSLMKNYTDEQLLRASKEEIDFLQKFARFITGNNVLNFTQLFDEAHYYVERNAHAKLLFTNITFEVMRYIHRA